MTVAKELSKYKLHFVGVKKVRWVSGRNEPTVEYKFVCGKGNKNPELSTLFFST
jgi:hypothetical protein